MCFQGFQYSQTCSIEFKAANSVPDEVLNYTQVCVWKAGEVVTVWGGGILIGKGGNCCKFQGLEQNKRTWKVRCLRHRTGCSYWITRNWI